MKTKAISRRRAGFGLAPATLAVAAALSAWSDPSQAFRFGSEEGLSGSAALWARSVQDDEAAILRRTLREGWSLLQWNIEVVPGRGSGALPSGCHGPTERGLVRCRRQ